METLEYALIPIILGLCELAKQAGVPSRWIPLVSLFLGVLFGVFYVSPVNTLDGILQGVVLGLSSMGLYSGPKSVFKGGR
jgi:hypothetical protein